MENNLHEKEKQLASYDGEDKIITSHELAEELKNLPPAPQLKTNIPTLDKILNNIEGGELIIVSGPTGHGKTTLLMTISANMAQAGQSTAWFTLEVTPRQFIKKLEAQHDELPLFYLPRKNIENNIQWLIDRIIEAKVKHDVQAVFVDHLHQIFSIDRFNGKNLSLEIGDIVARLKQLSIDYSLPVFLVAHSTDNKERPNSSPKMMDIRDSGMISRLADTVLGIWRVNENGNLATGEDDLEKELNTKLRVWKNRREGELGSLLLKHKNHYYQELDKELTYDEQKSNWADF